MGYDAAGNVVTDQAIVGGTLVSRTFTYWLSDQLRQVQVNGVLKATYYYNAQRQRTRKILVGAPANTPTVTLYRYDPNGHLLEEIAGTAFTGSLGSSVVAGTSLTTYVWKDDVLAAVIYAPGTVSNPIATERIVYVEVDHLNTPRKATDSTGKVVWTWESDAFGSSTPNEDPDNDGKKTVINLRFPGQYFDVESGLHYNWHRFYDPQVGRYTQPDPLGLAAGANPYAYVGGNPLSYIDPMGLVEIPSPNGVVPGGPWTPHDANRPGQFLGPKPDGGGGRAQCQFVPDEANGGPPGSKGYWKTNQPGQKGWQRYGLDGKPIDAGEAHKIPLPRIPGMAPLLCPLCTIIYPNGPGGDFSGPGPS